MLESALPPDAVMAVITLLEHNPRQAVEEASALASQPDIAPFWFDYTLGIALLAWERVLESRPYLMRASEAAAEDGLPQLWRIHCQRGVRIQESMAGQSTTTEAWEDLINQYSALGDNLEAARTAIYLARAWHSQRSGDVDTVVDRWIGVFDPRRHASDMGRLLRVQGASLVNKGNYAEASQIFDMALACFRQDGNLIEIARCYLEQAWLAIRREALTEAEALLDMAETIFEANDLPLQLTFVNLNRSILCHLRCHFAAALFYCQQARDQFHALQRIIDIGSCELELGAIYEQIGHWEAAQAHYTLALALFEVGAAPGRALMCYLNLASIAALGKDSMRAEHFLRLYEQFPASAKYVTYNAAAKRIRANILVEQGRFATAVRLLDEAAAIFVRNGDTTRAAECRLERVWLSLRHALPQNNPASLLSELARDLAEQPIHQWRAFYGLAHCCAAAGDFAGALNHYQTASELVFTMRRQLASEHLSSSLFNQAAEMYRAALHCAIDATRPLVILRLAEHQHALTLQRLLLVAPPTIDANPKMEEALNTIRQINHPTPGQLLPSRATLQEALDTYTDSIAQTRHRHFPPDIPVQNVNLADIQAGFAATHGDDWTLLYYVWLDETLLILMIDSQGIHHHCVTLDAGVKTALQLACDRTARKYTFRNGGMLTGVQAVPWEPLVTLGAFLLPMSLQPRLHEQHRLYIVPAGILHALPWAALRVLDNWLCDRAIVQIVPSISLLEFNYSIRETGNVFLGGCSKFDGRHPPLDKVESELSTLDRLYSPTHHVAVDPDCTLSVIHKALRQNIGYDVIHLATHANVRSSQAVVGSIAFADGELWLDEITRLSVNNAQVILSTCDGAIADVLPGEENLSLTWAWIIAGASGVLASLWPITDGRILPLIGDIHASIIAGQDLAAALTAAQRQHIKHGESPLDWGGFLFTSQHVGLRRTDRRHVSTPPIQRDWVMLADNRNIKHD
ncbi:CHAT domain-containing protein [Herpetosiphon llansteffanensis]|uniref:CHAT domain-containing protein n=1 Tax=Herpetosiphon llansteffanensis TaxID=2094568 RepID=UPI000D7BAB4F|nr:CHAT domain-containing protein [Herpetosiphon llansteffanensis]